MQVTYCAESKILQGQCDVVSSWRLWDEANETKTVDLGRISIQVQVLDCTQHLLAIDHNPSLRSKVVLG